jgi:hypothetical protein
MKEIQHFIFKTGGKKNTGVGENMVKAQKTQKGATARN